MAGNSHTIYTQLRPQNERKKINIAKEELCENQEELERVMAAYKGQDITRKTKIPLLSHEKKKKEKKKKGIKCPVQ